MENRSQDTATLDRPQRAAVAFGCGIGATIMSVLGFLWLGWGFGSVNSFTAVGWTLLYLATIVLTTVAVRAFLRAKALMKLYGARREQLWAEHGKQFKLITIFEGTGCGIVVLFTVHFHRPELIASGIALVVGLHFLPLARLLSFSLYYWVGAAIIACAAFSVFLFQGEAVTAVAGVGTGAILWAMTLYALRRSRQFSQELQGN